MKKVILLFVFVIFSCSGGGDDDVENNPSLTITNQNDIITITEINLVGYKFGSLNIGLGESKTFQLSSGLNGGMNDVNVSFSWSCGGRGWSGNTSLDFTEGNTTRITLIDTFDRGDGGCRDVGYE